MGEPHRNTSVAVVPDEQVATAATIAPLALDRAGKHAPLRPGDRITVASAGAAELLDLSERQFRALVTAGEIAVHPIRWGRSVRYSVIELTDVVRERVEHEQQHRPRRSA